MRSWYSYVTASPTLYKVGNFNTLNSYIRLSNSYILHTYSTKPENSGTVMMQPGRKNVNPFMIQRIKKEYLSLYSCTVI